MADRALRRIESRYARGQAHGGFAPRQPERDSIVRPRETQLMTPSQTFATVQQVVALLGGRLTLPATQTEKERLETDAELVARGVSSGKCLHMTKAETRDMRQYMRFTKEAERLR